MTQNLPGANAMSDGVGAPSMKEDAMKDAARVVELDAFVRWIKTQAERTDPMDEDANMRLMRQTYDRACRLVK